MSLKNCSVGSIMGAMVQQIGIENDKVIKTSLRQTSVMESSTDKALHKKQSSSLMRKQSQMLAAQL